MKITRRVDKLGRVVLPIDFREQLGIGKNDQVAISCDVSQHQPKSNTF